MLPLAAPTYMSDSVKLSILKEGQQQKRAGGEAHTPDSIVERRRWEFLSVPSSQRVSVVDGICDWKGRACFIVVI